ncbi:MAG: hypothetical protein RSA27_04400, partial [Oscillospiraceae bacterium]
NTFNIDDVPSGLYATADSYYIAFLDGIWHAPQQDSSGKMWTRSPENCRLQYFASLPNGDYIIKYTLEYLNSAVGTYDNTEYYAVLKKTNSKYGYTATELGTINAMPDEYKNSDFLKDARKGSMHTSNLKFDYEKVNSFETFDDYAKYLKEVFAVLNGSEPTAPAVEDVSKYIKTACSRLSKTTLSSIDNKVEISDESIKNGTKIANKTSKKLWSIAEDYKCKPNKTVDIPLQITIDGLNDKFTPSVVLDKNSTSLKNDVTEMRILFGDNRHAIILSNQDYEALTSAYGNMMLTFGLSKKDGTIIEYFNENGNKIDYISATPKFAIPANDKYDTVYYTHSDGTKYNIGGKFDNINQTLEVSSKFPGLFEVENNSPNISDIGNLDGALQDKIKYLVSKEYFLTVRNSFKPNEPYSRYDAALALSGMLYIRDPNAKTTYYDLSVTDPQYLSVASIDNANINIYSNEREKAFNGTSAVGLETTYGKSLELLANIRGYKYPKISNDKDLPYQSIYINFPDISFANPAYIDELALGAREGLINDGMTLFADENTFDRHEAVEFLYAVDQRLNETSPISFNATSNYASTATRFKPSSPKKFDVPPIMKVYTWCFAIGIVGYLILKFKPRTR